MKNQILKNKKKILIFYNMIYEVNNRKLTKQLKFF